MKRTGARSDSDRLLQDKCVLQLPSGWMKGAEPVLGAKRGGSP
jgi:hypothetical protein